MPGVMNGYRDDYDPRGYGRPDAGSSRPREPYRDNPYAHDAGHHEDILHRYPSDPSSHRRTDEPYRQQDGRFNDKPNQGPSKRLDDSPHHDLNESFGSSDAGSGRPRGPYRDDPSAHVDHQHRDLHHRYPSDPGSHGRTDEPYSQQDKPNQGPSRRLDDSPHHDLNESFGSSRDGHRENMYDTRLPTNGFGPPRDRGYNTRNQYGDPDGLVDGQTYELDHLATFTVGPKQGLQYPEDGIKKLKQMEMTTGIWTMRVQMYLEPQDIVIVDRTTGDEMERFPLPLIFEPTAVTNKDPRDVYNNIVLFTVQEDSRRGAPSEMHIFQSISRPAQDVVDDIRGAKAGRGRGHYIPAPDLEQARVRDQIREYELVAERTANAATAYQPGPRPSRAFREALQRDDVESVLSEKTDRDVQLLNHCFDDIERFVGRLQMAAEAYKELDRRRRTRDRRYKRGPGDGMLSMRARPPPATDFIDVFQKFKLAFNLLAKLKPHIHDPNAPELVHFLFTPLSLVVEASKDPRHGTPDLAANVVAPLLSQDAKDLLLNCLTSKESELWLSLGKAWTVSRESWKGYVPPFFPRFSDGWQPAPTMLDEGQQNAISEAVMAHNNQIHRRNERDRAIHQAEDHVMPYPRGDNRYGDTVYKDDRFRDEDPYARRPPPAPPLPRDLGPDPRVAGYQAYVERHIDRNREAQREHERERPSSPRPASPRPTSPPRQSSRNWDDEQRSFLRELRDKNAKICEAIAERTGTNNKELTVRKGEVLEVLDTSRNWWKLRNAKGGMGHAPFTILQLEGSEQGNMGAGPSPMGSGHSPTSPYNSIPSESRTPTYHEAQRAAEETESQKSHSSYEPPRTRAIMRDRLSDKKASKKEKEKRKSLQKELEKRVNTGGAIQTPGRKQTRSSQLYINQNSSPDEVLEWLRFKGFTRRTQQQLTGYGGLELFEMDRTQLERILGRDEGMRLDSQLKVQRNLAGYMTQRSAELQRVLQARKERADSGEDDPRSSKFQDDWDSRDVNYDEEVNDQFRFLDMQ